jgi:EmrB/QacA subfamily drug resistance transporter
MIQGCSVGSSRGRWILLATLLASSTAFLMGTAVTVALPVIQLNFGASISGIQWVINSHLLTLAALLLIGGSLGDRFGRKRIFILGIITFSAGAILSGFAQTITYLIAFQALQGIGSALMIPQSLAIINVCFTEEQRGKAIGLWAGISGGIASLGPWLGGWLVESVSWRAVFFMTIPISISAIIITYIFIPENKGTYTHKLDWIGTLLVLLGLFGIVFGLIFGPVSGWNSIPVLACLICGLISISLFILFELRQSEPLVPLQIFKNPLVAGANAATLLLYFALNGVIFFLVLNFQQIQGYSPATAGLGLLPPIVLITLFAGPAGALADRIGPRIQMIVGPIVVSAGMLLLSLSGTDASYLKHFLPGLILFGSGMALVIAPLTKSALSVEPRFSGAASGANNAISRIAALMAVAILGAIVISTFTAHLNDVINTSSLAQIEQGMILSQSDRLGGISIPESFSEPTRNLVKNAIGESFIKGFRRAMIVGAALSFGAALVSMITIHNRRET